MRAIKILGVVILLSIMGSCGKDVPVTQSRYVFIKEYCATITVGGIVGITEKCFNVGEIVTGEEVTEGEVTIRIAEHTSLNDGPPGPSSYQEFLNIPVEYLELIIE